MWALIVLIVPQALGQREDLLRTEQTILRTRADEAAPRVLQLQAGGAVGWENTQQDALIPFVLIGGRQVATHWRLQSNLIERDTSHLVYVYETSAPHLRLTWEWRVRDSLGPIEHLVQIENLDSEKLDLPLQQSLLLNLQADQRESLQHIYINKGAGKPDPIGTHVVAVPQGYRWEGLSSTYALDGDAEIIPGLLLQRNRGAANGLYMGVEFGGRTRLSLARDVTGVVISIGLNPNPTPSLTSLAPDERFSSPTVFVGAYRGEADDAGNVLRPWVRRVLGNPTTWADPHYPWLVNNSWGSGMQVDEGLARHMIEDSAELGLELFHIDAGWFRGVGDWYPNEQKFPHGLRTISDYAHRLGLKFGIWVNWAEAGIDTGEGALNVHNPVTRSWMVADASESWTPEDFVGRTIDLGEPAAKEHSIAEIDRMVTSFNLDMIEHDGYVVAKTCSRADHQHQAPPAGYPTLSERRGLELPLAPNSTDVSYRATRAYYNIYAEERRKHPGLLFEICNDGGRMVDFGSAAHGDYFSITDTYDPLSNRQAFYDASYLLPPAMLETYIERWPSSRMESFRYMLRSGMMGWLTIMQDTNAWSVEQHEVAKQEFALYKDELRPLIRDASLYHVSKRPDGMHWDGMEYYDPSRNKGVVYVFRGSDPVNGRHLFRLKGLAPEARYRARFHDHTNPDLIGYGRDLMEKGLAVALPYPNSSELVFFDRVKP